MKTSKDRGIVRIDQPEKYNHGWWVRRRRGAKMFSRFFADKKHGGKNKARVAAREFNDGLTSSLPPVSRRRSRKAKGMSSKAMSGKSASKAYSGAKSRMTSNGSKAASSSNRAAATKGRTLRFMQTTTKLPQRRRFAVAR